MVREQAAIKAQEFDIQADKQFFMANPHVRRMGNVEAEKLYTHLAAANLAVHGGARDALNRLDAAEQGQSPFIGRNGRPEVHVLEGHEMMLEAGLKHMQVHGGTYKQAAQSAINQTINSATYQRLAKESGVDIRQQWNSGLKADITDAMRELDHREHAQAKEHAPEPAHAMER